MAIPADDRYPIWKLAAWFIGGILVVVVVIVLVLIWPFVNGLFVSRPSPDAFIAARRPALEAFLADAGRIQAAKAQTGGRGAWFRQVGDHLWILVMQDGSYVVALQAAAKEEGRLVSRDIFWGRGSDGREYRSDFHFCIGLCLLMEEEQPASLDAFAALEARLRKETGSPSR